MRKKEEALVSLVISIFIEAILFIPMGTVWSGLFDQVFKIGEILNIELPIFVVIAILVGQFIVTYLIVFYLIALILGLYYRDR